MSALNSLTESWNHASASDPRTSRCPVVDRGPAERAGATDGHASAYAIIRYHREALMIDVLIRNVPDDVIAAVDARARRLGLSRSEYVRRRLAQDAAAANGGVTTQDLTRFAETFGDLADPAVMSQAWR
jgi:hypothetical protein